MGLFDKKFCDICGEKIGLLGNRKLEDGNLCKNCAKKLSPWFDERRHSTVEQIKGQLAYREKNRAQATAFNITRSFGKGSHKLYVDDNARKFTVARSTNFADENPDILDFSQAVGCDLNIDEHRREKRRTVDGKSVSYNPPRYEYSYDFKVKVRVSHQYFDDMSFNLKGSSVDTGERCMTGMNTGAWNVNSVVSNIFGQNGVNEYNEMVQLGNEMKAMIDSWRTGAQAGFGVQPGFVAQAGYGAMGAVPMGTAPVGAIPVGAAQTGTVRFGSAAPVPYADNIGGMPVSLGVRFSGMAAVSVFNPATVQNFGGLDALQGILQNELAMAANTAVSQCGAQGIPFAQLTARTAEINQNVKASLEGKWASQYGVALNAVSFNGFNLTEESQAQYQQMQQYQNQQYQQPQYQQPQYQQSVSAAPAGWVCPHCGTQNTGKFCTGCGCGKA